LYTTIIVYKKKKSKRLKPNKWLKSLALQNFLTKYTIKTREFRIYIYCLTQEEIDAVEARESTAK
jgi:hypothetical protein